MTPTEAAKVMIELTAAFPATRMPAETVNVWRKWLEALPAAEARRAVLLVSAQEDFPTVHQMIAACGISSEPVVAMLVAAREGGYELVRDDRARHGWRTSQDALPGGTPTGVPIPPDVRKQIKARLAQLAESKRLREPRPESREIDLAAAQSIVNGMPSQVEFEADVAREAQRQAAMSAEDREFEEMGVPYG